MRYRIRAGFANITIAAAPKYRRKGCGKNRGAHQNRMEENRAGKHLTMLE
jgi:hypothetical protein